MKGPIVSGVVPLAYLYLWKFAGELEMLRDFKILEPWEAKLYRAHLEFAVRYL